MEFKVIERFGNTPGRKKAYLTWDDWNDYSYRTLYGLVYVDDNKIIHEIGGVKIGYVEQETVTPSLNLGETFTTLQEKFFSLGTSDEYYENLNNLGASVRDEILIALRDIAKSAEIYEIAIEQDVTQTSLLRFISPSAVTGQFRRICKGGPRLTSYKFRFICPPPEGSQSAGIELYFEISPDTFPPTNIHVLIGRNGVGKTYLVNNMINSLVTGKQVDKFSGEFIPYDMPDNESLFVNLVSITFSAFDEFNPLPEQLDKNKGILYYYIGLKQTKPDNKKILEPKSTEILCDEFLESLNSCKIEPKYSQWKQAITTLESDINFRDSEIKDIVDIKAGIEYNAIGKNIFKRLSSGHKIILLTITRLIERVQERTLILIDEPEAHLHPPLLSSFIRALSDLLIDTNGVAIIATHSPVILQEVPKNCVWKLRRIGIETIAERPGTETFGENVGTLTSDIFGLEVTTAGFYQLLQDKVAENKSYEQIIEEFGNQLGMEARAILMALIQNKNK